MRHPPAAPHCRRGGASDGPRPRLGRRRSRGQLADAPRDGTSRQRAAHHGLGFIPPEYPQNLSDAHPSGTYIPPKLIGPALEDQSTFNIKRARIGGGGTGFPLEGMIFQGPHLPNNLFNDFKARGGYVEGAYLIPNTPFELQLRYDTDARNVDQPSEATFDTWTAGLQYHFNKKTRATLDRKSVV